MSDIETKSRFPFLLVLALLAVLAAIWWLTGIGDADELSEEQAETAAAITPDEAEVDAQDMDNLERATPADVVITGEDPDDGDDVITTPATPASEPIAE